MGYKIRRQARGDYRIGRHSLLGRHASTIPCTVSQWLVRVAVAQVARVQQAASEALVQDAWLCRAAGNKFHVYGVCVRIGDRLSCTQWMTVWQNYVCGILVASPGTDSVHTQWILLRRWCNNVDYALFM